MPVKRENVELTKVHYYSGDRELPVYSISGRLGSDRAQKSLIIKKNIFGHKWVLKINEDLEGEVKKKKKKRGIRFALYSAVTFCILVALIFGLYFAFDRNIKEKNQANPKFSKENKYIDGSTESESDTEIENFEEATTASGIHICKTCHSSEEVCIKTHETSQPTCLSKLDRQDPTGCGGLCRVNLEHCKLLDKEHKVYQCVVNKNRLLCPPGQFNCGNRCVPMEKRCDGVVDCLHHLDEKDCSCDLSMHFQCGNETSCLPNEKKCDGVINCWDKSDEIDCKKPNCDINEVPCINGDCIEKSKFCDGIVHCLDKSDEPFGCIK